ncbi:hypothetical protein D3C84_1071120 [compost metagenome]
MDLQRGVQQVYEACGGFNCLGDAGALHQRQHDRAQRCAAEPGARTDAEIRASQVFGTGFHQPDQ